MSNLLPHTTQPHPSGFETNAFVLRKPPKYSTGLIVSCPHAGIFVPKGFEKRLTVNLEDVLNRGDRFTDWLTHEAPAFGAHQIICKAAPSFLNVGRQTDSIYPKDVRGGIGDLAWNPQDIYCGGGQGQGVVAAKTLYGGFPIYKDGQNPDAAEIQNRIDEFHKPYHEQLEALVNDAIQDRGHALVFDIHSCPSIGAPGDTDPGQKRADLVISNANNTSCDAELFEQLCDAAANHGLCATENAPYTGGYVTRKFAKTTDWGAKGVQSVQIEFNRESMGTDEQTMELIDPQKFMRMQNFASDAMEIMAHYNLGNP
jgi:N-formylglutamate amidohydrolase